MKNYLFSVALLLLGFLFAVIHTAPTSADANAAASDDVLVQDWLDAAGNSLV